MKWNILVASMVLGLGLSTQSYGDLLDRMLGSKGSGCEEKDGCVQKCSDPKCGGCAQKGCHAACTPKCGRISLLAGCAHKDPCQKGCKDPSQKACKDPCQKACKDPCQEACKDPCQKACKDPCQKGGKGDCALKCGCGLLGGGLFCRCNHGCDAKGGKDPCQKACKDPCQKACKDPCQKACKDPCQKGCAVKSCGSSLLERIFARRHACCDSKCGKDGKGGHKADDSIEPAADDAVPPAPVVDPSAFLKSQRQVITASATLVR